MEMTSVSASFAGHALPQVVVLALRVVEAVLRPLHVLPFVSSEPLHSQIDQTVASRLVAAALPPHCASQVSRLDIVDFCHGVLGIVVGHHCLGLGVVAPGC